MAAAALSAALSAAVVAVTVFVQVVVVTQSTRNFLVRRRRCPEWFGDVSWLGGGVNVNMLKLCEKILSLILVWNTQSRGMLADAVPSNARFLHPL